MPDNRVNGEDFKEFNPNNGVNNKEEGNDKKFSTDNSKEDTNDISKEKEIINNEQIEDNVLDNSKDDVSNKSVPFSNNKAKDNSEEKENFSEIDAPFIEKTSTKTNEKQVIKKSDVDVKKEHVESKQKKDRDLSSLLEDKNIIMIDDKDSIDLVNVNKSDVSISDNIAKVDEDFTKSNDKSKSDSKNRNSSDNLPETFNDLIAEEPGWKPNIKSENSEKQDTIIGAINNFYKDQKCYKYPLLNKEDSNITDFDVSDGIYAYKRMEPFPHWHFVTNKLSDLYVTLWDGSKASGVGFELSFRIKSDENVPPDFGIKFMQEFSGYAYSSGNFIASGHVIPIKGITKFPRRSALNAVTAVYDMDIKPVETEKGVREFLQIVGITKDEQIAIKSWNSNKTLDLFSKYLDMFITDIDRRCLLEIEEVDKTIQEGIKKDGSNTGMIFGDKVIWKKKRKLIFFTEYIIEVDSDSIRTLEKVIKGRIPKSRDLIIVGDKNKIIFKPNPNSFTSIQEESLIIGLSQASFKDFLTKIKNKIKIFRVKSLVNTKFRVV